MNYQQLFLPWFGNQSGGETVKPWGTWLVESDRKLRDGTGWWRNLSVRRVWLLPRVVERFSVMVLYKVEYDQIDPESFSLLLWVLWLMNFTIDHHMTKTRWSKRHWLWTTRSSWTLDLASSNPRHLKGSGWKESQSSKSSSSRFILGRKKWDPPNPSWILEGDTWIRRPPIIWRTKCACAILDRGLNHLFASLEAINSRWGQKDCHRVVLFLISKLGPQWLDLPMFVFFFICFNLVLATHFSQLLAGTMTQSW